MEGEKRDKWKDWSASGRIERKVNFVKMMNKCINKEKVELSETMA